MYDDLLGKRKKSPCGIDPKDCTDHKCHVCFDKVEFMLEVLPDDHPILIERQRLAETEYRYRREDGEPDGELPQEDVKLFTDLFDPDKANQLTDEANKVLDEMMEELNGDGVIGRRREALHFPDGTIVDYDEYEVTFYKEFIRPIGRRIKALFEVRQGFCNCWSCTLKRLKEFWFKLAYPSFHWIIFTAWAALWLVGLPYLTYFLYTTYGNATMAEVVKEWEVIKGWII